MFEVPLLLVIFLLLVVWAVAVTFLYNVGPGTVHRLVQCPEKHERANLVVLYKEPVWGRLEAADVMRCSLLSPGPVNCGKECLARL